MLVVSLARGGQKDQVGCFVNKTTSSESLMQVSLH